MTRPRPEDADLLMKGSKEFIYKDTPQGGLKLFLFKPDGSRVPSSCIVHFTGGGWVEGRAENCSWDCVYHRSKGMAAITVDYRVTNRHGTTPFECMEDVIDSIIWIRDHADDLGINPARIAGDGGSAGGHLLLCAELFSQDPRARPDLMILHNPVVDTTETGYGKDAFGPRYREVSPIHHIRPGMAPTLILHGTRDRAVPFENAERFCRIMREAGNECKLEAFEGRDHSFDWPPAGDDFEKSMGIVSGFLEEHGFLS